MKDSEIKNPPFYIRADFDEALCSFRVAGNPHIGLQD